MIITKCTIVLCAFDTIPRRHCFGDFFMTRSKKTEFMREALVLAEKGRLLVSPNPMVGALVVKNSGVVAKGFHRGAGKEHAESGKIRSSFSPPYLA